MSLYVRRKSCCRRIYYVIKEKNKIYTFLNDSTCFIIVSILYVIRFLRFHIISDIMTCSLRVPFLRFMLFKIERTSEASDIITGYRLLEGKKANFGLKPFYTTTEEKF